MLEDLVPGREPSRWVDEALALTVQDVLKPLAAPPAAKFSYEPPEGRGQGEGGGVKPENLTTP